MTLAAVFSLLPSRAAALVWPDVPERVERGLRSPDPASRRAAAKELSSLGAQRATPLVLEALGDADTEVRLAASQSATRLRIAPATDAVLGWLGEREARLRSGACDVAQAMPNPRAVQALARALGDSDPQVRAACAAALGAQRSAEAVAPLSGKLDDPTPNVRIEVARSLARLGDSRAVVPLVGKVQDSVPDVRQAVVRALGDLGDVRASQALLLALRDNVPEVKIEALAALGRLQAPDAALAIAPLALERNPSVRQAALVALGRIATADAVRALVRALGTQDDANAGLERTPVREALVSAGSPAVTELTALLARPTSPAIATSAAWVLGELRATASAPAIVAALRSGTLPPAGALHALAGAGTSAEVPIVLEFVGDPSLVVREEALRAAAALLDPAHPDGRAVEPLAATLKSARTSPQERAAVATLLGRTGAPRAATELASLASAKDSLLQLAAIDALGELGSASAAVDDALVPRLDDTDPIVRLHAAVALSSSGGPTARSALLSKLDGGQELDRFAVWTALGGILERHPDASAIERLESALAIAAGAERDAVIEAAFRARVPRAVSALAALASRGSVDDRRAVAAALGAHRGSPEALGVAKNLLRDGDSAVRAQAAFTIGTLGDSSSIPQLGALVRDADADVAGNAAGGIARIAASAGKAVSAAVTSAVCPMLADRRPIVRANALAALAGASARCGDGRAERRLLVDDEGELVRANAARALTAASLGADDRTALERCAGSERSVEVAAHCRARPGVRAASTRTKPVTIFIVGESGGTARPRAPFLLEYEGGILRAGVADRRGATFEPGAPAGEVVLRRSPRAGTLPSL